MVCVVGGVISCMVCVVGGVVACIVCVVGHDIAVGKPEHSTTSVVAATHSIVKVTSCHTYCTLPMLDFVLRPPLHDSAPMSLTLVIGLQLQ